MSGDAKRPPRSVRVVAGAYLPLVAAGTAALAARAAGVEVSPAVVAAAAAVLALAALTAAACAAHAFLRRRWWWGAALLALWPLAVPAYLWRLEQAEV